MTARHIPDPTGELHHAAHRLDAFNATTLTLALVTLALLLGMAVTAEQCQDLNAERWQD